MTEPIEPRPQPVVDIAGQLGGLAKGAFTAVFVLVNTVAVEGITSTNIGTVGNLIGLAVAAVGGLVMWLVSLFHARKAAEHVTPLSDPRNARMEPLVDPDSYGRHAAKAEDGERPPALDPDEQWLAAIRATKELPRMSDRHGIHAHPTKKLGKLKPIPGRKAVAFGQFVATVPEHPLVDAAPRLVFPMDRNDVAGDCVVAGLDHALQVICALLGVPRLNWTDEQLLAFYRTQNPGFRTWADGGDESRDGGMIIQTFLEYLVAQKVILAFGKVDHTSEEEMKAAVYLGLAVVTGEVLDVAQQTQPVWDYQRSAEWGGHCTTTVGYQASPDRQTVVSWGELVDVTQAFISHQLDEAWFVLTQAHVDHPAFREHFDLAGFAAAVSALTGSKVVVPVPPTPAPSPAPSPAPPPAPAPTPSVDFPRAQVDPWLTHVHTFSTVEKVAKQAVKDWLAQR